MKDILPENNPYIQILTQINNRIWISKYSYQASEIWGYFETYKLPHIFDQFPVWTDRANKLSNYFFFNEQEPCSKLSSLYFLQENKKYLTTRCLVPFTRR